MELKAKQRQHAVSEGTVKSGVFGPTGKFECWRVALFSLRFPFLLWKFYGFQRAVNLSSVSLPRSDGGCSRVSSVNSTSVLYGLTWSPQPSGRTQATDPDLHRSRIGCSQGGAWCPGGRVRCGTPSKEQTGYVHCTCVHVHRSRTHLKSLNGRGEAEAEEEHQGGDSTHHLHSAPSERVV